MNRLPSRLFALLAVAALAPMAACGSDDDDTTSATDAGTDGSVSGGSQDGDGGSGLDATSSVDAGGPLDSGTTPGLDGSTQDADAPDAAGNPCTPVNGTYTLNGPETGSTEFCPSESGVVCLFATAAGTCALTSQCAEADGGAGAGLLAIPTGTLDGNDTLSYSATYGIIGGGTLTTSCSLSFTSNQTKVSVTCAGSVAPFGTVSCSYSGTDQP